MDEITPLYKEEKSKLEKLCSDVRALDVKLSEIKPYRRPSQMSRDNNDCRPHRLDVSAYNSITFAIDHLVAVDSMARGRGIPVFAAITTLRASLEGAARAIGLLLPKDRKTRISAHLSYLLDSAKYQTLAFEKLNTPALTNDFLKESRKTAEEHKSEIDEYVSSQTQKHGLGAIRKEEMWQIVENASYYCLGSEDNSLLFYWMACSGIAHSKGWAMDAFTKVVSKIEDTESHSNVVFGADMKFVLGVYEAALMTSEKALELYVNAGKRKNA